MHLLDAAFANPAVQLPLARSRVAVEGAGGEMGTEP